MLASTCSRQTEEGMSHRDARGAELSAIILEDKEGKTQQVLIHQHPVTVAQFARYVRDSAYLSTAERLGSAGAFDFTTFRWELVEGANWQYPRGQEHPAAAGNHPVTQVSWYDALAYCHSLGMELPSQALWEEILAHESEDKNGRFVWGDELNPGGKYAANYWQGVFPLRNTEKDGYLMTSPVGTFGESRSGLQDLSGNVWEWCSDWYAPSLDGPDSLRERVQVGGSFMCAPQDCLGFARGQVSHSTPETALFHVGFRCVQKVGK